MTTDEPVSDSELRLAAMDLLARREHARKELAAKLSKRFRSRELSADSLERVLDRLEEEALLSDARFAASTLRQLASRGYGPRRVLSTLREKGVGELAPEALATAAENGIDWVAEAEQAYRKKFSGQPISGDWSARQREKAKRLRFMQYRGFSAEVSAKLVDQDDDEQGGQQG